MITKETDKFFTVETITDYMHGGYDTYEAAEARARKEAYQDGADVAIMGVVAIARKPVAVNTVAVEKV